MLKSLLLIIICTVALPGFCEPAANYEVATIVDVRPHQSAGDRSSPDVASYDVSVRVGKTIYVVLYTDTSRTGTVKYVAGRQALVHIGKNSITYNDIVGQSHEVPIIDQKLATAK